MKTKGFGGALLVDANGAAQNGNKPVSVGPKFGSPAWRELYVHALKEADRLGLEITLNILSGWNLGGPDVTSENASKLLTFSDQQTHITDLTGWTGHDSTKYFSGTAVYRVTFITPQLASGEIACLHFKSMREIATIELNGRQQPSGWAPPCDLNPTIEERSASRATAHQPACAKESGILHLLIIASRHSQVSSNFFVNCNISSS